KADAQERCAPRNNFAQHRHQVEAVQRRHRVAESADAGQQDSVGGEYGRLVAGDRRFEPGVLAGVLDAEQVAQAVIDDGYLGRWEGRNHDTVHCTHATTSRRQATPLSSRRDFNSARDTSWMNLGAAAPLRMNSRLPSAEKSP